MTKWKCDVCGEKVTAADKPPHCPNGHDDIVKVRRGPLEWLMHKLNFRQF